VVVFERLATPGGLMRSNIPSFRLPATVIDDEIGLILDMGVELRLGHAVTSLRQLLEKQGFDAVFVGSGAPKGKDSSCPAGAIPTASTSASTGSSRWPSGTSTRSASAS